MTYITPDDVHDQMEADRLTAHLRLTARLVPGPAYPLLNNAPTMPLRGIRQRTLPTRPTSMSPYDQDHRDLGPGGFIPLG